jgi:aarF domain-containing kinase
MSWPRVANGLRIVATDGASRISRALLSADPQSAASSLARHVPEVASSVLRQFENSRDAFVNQEVPQHDRTACQTASGEAHQPRAVLQNAHAATTNSINRSSVDETIEDTTVVEIKNLEASAENGKSTVSQMKDSSKVVASQRNQSAADAQTDSSNKNTFSSFENQIENYDQDHEAQHLPEGSAVPSSRIARAFGFASLGAGLAVGTVAELARRALGNSNNSESLVLSNDANAQRLADSLRRMRGAAMKLGQMLSIQDESIAPPALTNALAQVRKGAEAMPTHQLMSQLDDEWVDGWKDKVDLDDRPFAAASIGQVHRGTLLSADCVGKKVAVKVQYPGVADSIESDLSNLSMLVKATGLAPPGLFLDNVIRVGREELKVECDYLREMENHKRFQKLISSDPILAAERFTVPEVYEDLCTNRILVTEYVKGGTIDKVVDMDQAERNRIGRAILRLTMLELFVWRFMQTDPNWGNFLYDVRTRTTYLIDFGAAREYDKEFVRGYLNIVTANANRDETTLMEESIRMGFLTGDENDIMLEAHKLSGFCLGEPFQSYEPYDFKSSRITSRISEHGSVFLKHRLT